MNNGLVLGAALQLAGASSIAAESGKSDWPAYGGDAGSRQYSALEQITPANVHKLETAWVYRSAPGYELPLASELQVNPLVVDGVLYGISPQYKVFALDASTGSRKWEFDPVELVSALPSQGAESKMALRLSHKRGLAYWHGTEGARLYFSVAHLLFAIDAGTGELVQDFGNGGIVDLREGLGRPVEELGVAGNTPGSVFGDLLIMGSRVGENEAAAPGHIRAYDVRTGRIIWTFHTIPQPGEPGYETWPTDGWQRFGGSNAWAGMSVDHARGLVFAPLGSPSDDFVGTKRHGKNLYGNSLVALDAGTGKLRWHYQSVHHDLWDRDLNSAPTLVTVRHDGRNIDAVAQTTKQGFVFLFDRDSGKPVFPIEEVPVQPSDVPGEQSWPTQPRPLLPPPFAAQTMGEADVTDISAEARSAVLEQWRELLPPAYFAPLGEQARILLPGYDGGATWGGPAFSPERRLLVVNAQNQPGIGQVAAMQGGSHQGNYVYQYVCSQCHLPNRQGMEGGAPSLIHLGDRLNAQEVRDIIVGGRGRMAPIPLPEEPLEQLVDFLLSDKAPPAGETKAQPHVFTGYRRLVDHEGYPGIKPPWGTLTAIDLDTGTFAWQSVLGEHEELTRRGVAQTGTLNYGGPVVTAAGLVFIAATSDSKLRAFDLATGKELWQATLPAPAFSTPAVYAVDGVQYIAVACGGGKLGQASGDAYVAFRLPD